VTDTTLGSTDAIQQGAAMNAIAASGDCVVPPEVQLERAACPMGCSDGDEPVITARDRLHDLPGTFTVVRCKRCGLMRTDPRPDSKTIGFYYPADYAPHHVSFPPARRASRKPMSWRRRARKTVRRWFGRFDPRELPIAPPGRLFEVGAANGNYLASVGSLGWQASGIDMSPSAVESGRRHGLDLSVGTVESIPTPQEPYDIVVGWMVFEHLHEPLDAFRRLREFVRPGGWLAFSIPDAGAVEFRVFGPRWYALQVPGHLTHFTARSITALLVRSGWNVERILWHPNPNNLLQSLRYWALDAGHLRLAGWLADMLAQRRAKRLHRYLGRALSLLHQSGRMTVWARRGP
jgi:SAM-dependent methyltransferase